jgi:hypothetical protein
MEPSNFGSGKISIGIAFSFGIFAMIVAITRVGGMIALTGGTSDMPVLALFSTI